MRRFRILLAAAAALGAAAPGSASATYSIVGTDSATQQVGGAGTSCVGTFSVYIIYGSAPGKGVVAAQAQVNTNGRDEAVQQLSQGVAPADIITAITAPNFDFNSASRQYGIAALPNLAAGFTGSSTLPYADDRQGQVGTYTYSTQGNILTSGAVLDNTSMTFETQGCDLADKLMLALEAGALNGEGDSRCTDEGIPSDGAFIQVDLPTGTAGSYLKLQVNNTKPQNPLPLLRAQFDTWRQANPCATGMGGAGGSGGGGMGGGGAGGGGTGGAGTGTMSGGSTVTSGAGGEGGAPGLDPDAESGCGCRVGASSADGMPGSFIASLGAAVWLGLRSARRRRRTR